MLFVAVPCDVEAITSERDRHQRRSQDILQLGFAVPAELFEKLRVQFERTGKAHLDSFRVAKPQSTA